FAGVSLPVVLLLEMLRDSPFLYIRPGMKPGLGPRRRHMRGGVDVSSVGERSALAERAQFFGIMLLYHPEAAELALDSVVISVMVGVAGDKAIAADPVIGLDPLDYMHWKRQPRYPGLPSLAVGKIEFGRRRVEHSRFGAYIVAAANQQMGFLAAH